MKNKQLLLATCLIMLSACNNQKVENIDKGELVTTFVVASDMHILSNNLISPDNAKYKKEVMTSDGRAQEKDYEIMEAFVSKINEINPNYVMLTGDLTFNGERDSHKELINIMNKVNENIKVLVIPGNHDVFNINARSYLNDKVEYVPTPSYEEFKTIYKDFGYNDAYSVASDSVSYAYNLDDHTIALMLDTTYSMYNVEFGQNIVGGIIQEETLVWIENILKDAQEKGKDVISFSHHNLIDHSEVFNSMYTIDNYLALLDLYKKYGVKLNFSGHLHIQNIASTDGIYDIASGSLIGYNNSFGKLSVYQNAYEYESISISEDLRNYSEDVFIKKYYDKSIDSYNEQYGDDGVKIAKLISKINAKYFAGEYIEVNKLIKDNKKLINKVKNNPKVSKYVLSIINVENKDQNYVLIKK